LPDLNGLRLRIASHIKASILRMVIVFVDVDCLRGKYAQPTINN
jgi:hypothetical protein